MASGEDLSGTARWFRLCRSKAHGLLGGRDRRKGWKLSCGAGPSGMRGLSSEGRGHVLCCGDIEPCPYMDTGLCPLSGPRQTREHGRPIVARGQGFLALAGPVEAERNRIGDRDIRKLPRGRPGAPLARRALLGAGAAFAELGDEADRLSLLEEPAARAAGGSAPREDPGRPVSRLAPTARRICRTRVAGGAATRHAWRGHACGGRPGHS